MLPRDEQGRRIVADEPNHFKALGVRPDEVTTLIPLDGGINMAMGFGDEGAFGGALHISAWHYQETPEDGTEPPVGSFVMPLNTDDRHQMISSVLALMLPEESIRAVVQLIVMLEQQTAENGKLSFAEDAASKSFANIQEALNEVREEDKEKD